MLFRSFFTETHPSGSTLSLFLAFIFILALVYTKNAIYPIILTLINEFCKLYLHKFIYGVDPTISLFNKDTYVNRLPLAIALFVISVVVAIALIEWEKKREKLKLENIENSEFSKQ